VPLEAVIEFKRQVYQLALIELARILFRSRSYELPDSYRLPEPEPLPEPVRVVIGGRGLRDAIQK
jgi:putative (di)nucleoside polyphosphate hydrolase